mgnify:CR=1 FL=1
MSQGWEQDALAAQVQGKKHGILCNPKYCNSYLRNIATFSFTFAGGTITGVTLSTVIVIRAGCVIEIDAAYEQTLLDTIRIRTLVINVIDSMAMEC